MIYKALTIAGSDPSGGAGIQADLKTFSANGVYGMSVITALTSQNTQTVGSIHFPPIPFITEQIDLIFSDIRVDAIKIGMIGNADIANAVADYYEKLDTNKSLVLDPVMVAKSGSLLLEKEAVETLCKRLIPLASIITPNLPEAAQILRTKTATNKKEMLEQANAILALGAKGVFLKGGHLETSESPDLYVDKEASFWLETERVFTNHTHGTGCTLSSAITANLAKQYKITDAVKMAKSYITQAIAFAEKLNVGNGHGPTHHFHPFW